MRHLVVRIVRVVGGLRTIPGFMLTARLKVDRSLDAEIIREIKYQADWLKPHLVRARKIAKKLDCGITVTGARLIP